MSRKCGMPWLKLNSKSYSGKQSQHHGNDKAVMCEAFEERWSADEDLNREETANNIYYGYKSGLELLNDINKEIKELSAKLKSEGKRGIREDAITSFAMVVKPDIEVMKDLSREQQKMFFEDALTVLRNKGLDIRGAVIHFDEKNPHMHVFGMPYTEDGRLSAKDIFTLKFNSWLNNDFADEMNKLHDWNLEHCRDENSYDVAIGKQLKQDIKTAEQSGDLEAIKKAKEAKEAYSKQCIEYKKSKKKQHGLNSTKYKAKQKINDIADEIIDEIATETRQEGILRNKQELDNIKRLEASYEQNKALYERLSNNMQNLINENKNSDKEAALKDFIKDELDGNGFFNKNQGSKLIEKYEEQQKAIQEALEAEKAKLEEQQRLEAEMLLQDIREAREAISFDDYDVYKFIQENIKIIKEGKRDIRRYEANNIPYDKDSFENRINKSISRLNEIDYNSFLKEHENSDFKTRYEAEQREREEKEAQRIKQQVNIKLNNSLNINKQRQIDNDFSR